jgi:Ca2+-binding RTX toxin-like protein
VEIGLARRTSLRAGLAVSLVATGLSVFGMAGTAHAAPAAGTVTIGLVGWAQFDAGNGVANQLTLTSQAGQVVFEDTAAPIRLNPDLHAGCTQLDVHRVRCAIAPDQTVFVLLSDRDDRFVNNTNMKSMAVGMQGNDRLEANGTGRDDLQGNDGDDLLIGGPGDDQLWGDGGQDTLHGEAGNDSLSGGDGHDIIYAGPGDDGVNAGAGGDHVELGPGNDYANGGSGADVILGGPGNDRLYGETGDDHLDAEAGTEQRTDGGTDEDICQGSAAVRVDCEH